MKPAPTLIDEIYRSCFNAGTNEGWKSNVAMRHALESARRFVVDEPMSAFMAELANESFIKAGPQNPLVLRIADSLRVQSRLPHDAIWIEYHLRVYQKRANEMHETTAPPPEEVPWREGWLIQQHPQINTAHIMHLFTQDAPADPRRSDGFQMWTFPFAFAWCCDDNPLPWQMTLRSVRNENRSEHLYAQASAYLVGLARYDRDNVSCVHSPLINDPKRDLGPAYQYLLSEWMGVLRRVWSLLATIDNIPMVRGEVRQSKGFLARGQIKKFLSHQTITLTVPFRQDTRVLARKLIAIAHRKRHEVRGHWRDDWRHPLGKCNPHLWEPIDDDADLIECAQCRGRQFYIHKHLRGDASLGFVTHDYSVRHNEGA